MEHDFLLNIFRYFARFVPSETLKKCMVSPDYAALSGAMEIVADHEAADSPIAIADIDTYVMSANPNFVEDRVKNSAKTILFIEHGQTAMNESGLAVAIDIAITIAKPYTQTNRDNLNELLASNEMNNLLIKILSQMKADSEAGCACGTFLFPADIQPIDPRAFYNRIGYVSFVRIVNPILSAAQMESEVFNTEATYGQSLLSNYYTKAQCDLRFALKSEIPVLKQSDWAQTDNTQADYIKNKPNIPQIDDNTPSATKVYSSQKVTVIAATKASKQDLNKLKPLIYAGL